MSTDLTVRAEIRASAFFASWGTSFEGMCDGFRTELAPECDWDQRPMLRTRTLDGALAFLTIAHHGLGLEYVDVDLLSIAVVSDARGDATVHTQRVDHLRRADGSLIASAPVAGVLTYSHDQVVTWREYFDPVVFSLKAVRSMTRHAALRPVRALRQLGN